MALENYALHLSYFHRTVCLAQAACVQTLKLTVFVSNKGSGEAPDRVSESAGPPRYITLKYRTSDCAFCGQVYLASVYVCEWMTGYLWNCLKHMHAAPRISQYWTPPALKVPERSSWGVERSEWSNYFMAQIQLSRGALSYTLFSYRYNVVQIRQYIMLPTES